MIQCQMVDHHSPLAVRQVGLGLGMCSFQIDFTFPFPSSKHLPSSVLTVNGRVLFWLLFIELCLLSSSFNLFRVFQRKRLAVKIFTVQIHLCQIWTHRQHINLNLLYLYSVSQSLKTTLGGSGQPTLVFIAADYLYSDNNGAPNYSMIQSSNNEIRGSMPWSGSESLFQIE